MYKSIPMANGDHFSSHLCPLKPLRCRQEEIWIRTTGHRWLGWHKKGGKWQRIRPYHGQSLLHSEQNMFGWLGWYIPIIPEKYQSDGIIIPVFVLACTFSQTGTLWCFRKLGSLCFIDGLFRRGFGGFHGLHRQQGSIQVNSKNSWNHCHTSKYHKNPVHKWCSNFILALQKSRHISEHSKSKKVSPGFTQIPSGNLT